MHYRGVGWGEEYTTEEIQVLTFKGQQSVGDWGGQELGVMVFLF